MSKTTIPNDETARYRVYNPFTENLHDDYLETLEETGLYQAAADSVGANVLECLKYRKTNPEFAERCGVALKRYQKIIIQEAHRRAVKGWEEPVVGGRNRDTVVTHVTKYSDRLMEMFLKRNADAIENGGFAPDTIRVEGGLELNLEMAYSKLSVKARKMFRELLVQIKEDDAARERGEVIE